MHWLNKTGLVTHVEQKNWTHVRQLLGYDRLADPALVPLLNDLYETAWGPFHNFFCPSVKLQQKQRVGSRYVKHHDAPQTPYQRLLQSVPVTAANKMALRERFAQLNPFALKQAIEEKLRTICHRLRYTTT